MALEDASTLKGKEWNRGEPDIRIHSMYSTIDGRLTPTAPTYEDMKIGTPLHRTPEESMEGLSAAVGDTVIEEDTQQPSTNADNKHCTSYLHRYQTQSNQ